jgi:hypothetical protein
VKCAAELLLGPASPSVPALQRTDAWKEMDANPRSAPAWPCSALLDQQHLRRATRASATSTGSPLLRYWNLARQRHYRGSAACRRALPVSAGAAACHGPHTGAEAGLLNLGRLIVVEIQTRLWSEPDSNSRSVSASRGSETLGPPWKLCRARRNAVSQRRDRRFESCLLQRGVCCELGRKPDEAHHRQQF